MGDLAARVLKKPNFSRCNLAEIAREVGVNIEEGSSGVSGQQCPDLAAKDPLSSSFHFHGEQPSASMTLLGAQRPQSFDFYWWDLRVEAIGHVMAHIDSKGSDLDVDLENGGTTSEEDGSKDSCSSDEHAKKLFGKVWSGLEGLDGTRGVDGLSSYNKLLNSGGISVGNLQILSDKLGKEREDFVEKKLVKDKWNKMASKMPRKPPRPPRGPSLDSADMMLVREISELTMLKRKRIERIKALKKMKAEKTPSFNSNLFAMMITVLFCFVIIFQGLLGSRV
ncbi:hypothetical protein F0562_020049 [Nyssa sinensis]|uniref:Uncharacterized protein n=1 Tax=Nyssa sinensis TaxID=561372 RepID=A0A5J5BQK2_9ASTE|nr:hypothetical protein F0562_020049 [Nyssa sinensis]